MGRLRQWRDSLVRRLRIAKNWLRDGKPLWLWLAVAVLLLGIPYAMPLEAIGIEANLADRVRWSAMLFQFAGLATVMHGLNRSRQLFNRSPVWKAALQWLGRIRHIFGRPRIVNLSTTINAGPSGISANATVTTSARSQSIEDRVAKLEADFKRLETTVAETGRNMRKIERETKDRIDRERRERAAEDRKISEQLETATIGGIHLEVAGVAYLFVGIFLASLPQETALILVRLGL